MSAKTARREYLQAVAEFERGVRAFARGMADVLDSAAPVPGAGEASPDAALPLLAGLGPRKPARRADSLPDTAISPREAGSGR